MPPGSLKAKTNVAGLGLIYALAAELGVPHRKTGKLVVALEDEGRSRLEELMAEGEKSGVPGLEIVDAAAIGRLEPLARGRWALSLPPDRDHLALRIHLSPWPNPPGGTARR